MFDGLKERIQKFKFAFWNQNGAQNMFGSGEDNNKLPDLEDKENFEIQHVNDELALEGERIRLNKLINKLNGPRRRYPFETRLNPASPKAQQLKAQRTQGNPSEIAEATIRLEEVINRIDELHAKPSLGQRALQIAAMPFKITGKRLAAVGLLVLSVVGAKTIEQVVFDPLSDNVEQTARLINLDEPEYAQPEVILFGQAANSLGQTPYTFMINYTYDQIKSTYDVTAQESGGSAIFIESLDEAAQNNRLAAGFAQADLYYEWLRENRIQNVLAVQLTGIADCGQLFARQDTLSEIAENGTLSDWMQSRAEQGDPVRVLAPNDKFGSYHSLNILFDDVIEQNDVEIVSYPQDQRVLLTDFADAGNNFDLAFYMESPIRVENTGLIPYDNPLPFNIGGDLFGLFNYSGQLGTANEINRQNYGIVSFSPDDFNALAGETGLPYNLEQVGYDEGVDIIPFSSSAINTDASQEDTSSANLICTPTIALMGRPEAYESRSTTREARALRQQLQNISFRDAMNVSGDFDIVAKTGQQAIQNIIDDRHHRDRESNHTQNSDGAEQKTLDPTQ